MNFRVAIPSYRRAELLRDKTLAMLARHGVAKEAITVAVADAAELANYLPLVGDLVGRLIIGAHGLAAQRIALRHAHARGDRLLWMDDDIEELMELRGDKLEPTTRFASTVEVAFDRCARAGLSLWGVAPAANAFYMSPDWKTGLYFCVGAFYGEINSHATRFDGKLAAKEDYERTLRHYLADGAVLRCNFVAPRTKFYGRDAGGLASIRTPAMVAAEVAWLKREFAGLVRTNQNRKSDYEEIRLVKPRTLK